MRAWRPFAPAALCVAARRRLGVSKNTPGGCRKKTLVGKKISTNHGCSETKIRSPSAVLGKEKRSLEENQLFRCGAPYSDNAKTEHLEYTVGA